MTTVAGWHNRCLLGKEFKLGRCWCQHWGPFWWHLRPVVGARWMLGVGLRCSLLAHVTYHSITITPMHWEWLRSVHWDIYARYASPSVSEITCSSLHLWKSSKFGVALHATITSLKDCRMAPIPVLAKTILEMTRLCCTSVHKESFCIQTPSLVCYMLWTSDYFEMVPFLFANPHHYPAALGEMGRCPRQGLPMCSVDSLH